MKYIPLFTLLAALLLAACAPAAQPAAPGDCPITPIDDPGLRLLGPENGLRAFVVNDGIWDQLPQSKDGGFGQKIMWKYPGYNWLEDPQPDFTLVAEELNRGTSFEVHEATNAYHEEDLLGSAILTGVEFPHAGCWQLSGRYSGDELTFVVWVGDAAAP